MYSQYTTEHQTEVGCIKLERTFKDGHIDSLLAVVGGQLVTLPKRWHHLTSKTIIRKICAIYK